MIVKEGQFFTAEQLSALNPAKIPANIAIIPDGNRRWAAHHLNHSPNVHAKGADVLIEIVKAAKELSVKAITFFTFSTENWSRPQEEIDALMILLETYLREQTRPMIENGIRFHTIGDINRFPAPIVSMIKETKKATAGGEEIDLILAINYGGRDDIRRAVQKIVDDYDQQRVHKEEITEQLITQYLDTAQWPDPDLFIRTSGEQRVSNFLLWQMSYTELYTPNVLWPDFTPQHLYKAVVEFQTRKRRFGGT